MIRLDSVSKIYRGDDGPIHALDEVTLEVEEGEFVAVCGPSGSGKSTFLTVVGALNTPTSGRVGVNGKDLQKMSGTERARFRAEVIGFVFQMFHLLPYLSAMENVLVPVSPGNRNSSRQRASELLGKFGLSERLGHRPEQLSTGERQRVAIARALINSPKLILADEPTGNLDPQSAGEVMDLLEDFHSTGGTVVLVTHQDVIAERAQRTISLHHGKIEG